ncbi:hypothetical protein V5N11_002514 [Cardamine amara subsp. amara]|uniref:SWIM-type domain-containing protein n=1 Tax=Cardamine amara subsp. amara TaxID=228776 RepID=A0ABD1BDH7_CARAN
MAAHREKITKLPEGELPYAVEKQCLHRFQQSVGCSDMCASRWEYEVVDTDKERYQVNLKDMTCSCAEFEKLNIPCWHVMAASHVTCNIVEESRVNIK